MAGKGLEFVGRAGERQAKPLAETGCHCFAIALGGIEARAHGGAADRQFVDLGQGVAKALQPHLQLGYITTEFLPQGEGHRILEVGAANLDHLGKRLTLLGKRFDQGLHCGDQLLFEFDGNGDVQSRWKGVVAGLTEVDVVVGVDGALAAQDPTGGFDGPVGNHLIHVHVGLGARAGLPHLQRELGVEGAGGHLLGSSHDQRRQFGAEFALGGIHLSAGGFELAKGMDHGQGHGLAEWEKVNRALGLGPPVMR